MRLSFRKLHGLGNDFLFVDARSLAYELAPLAPALCDRHRGVGGDGLLLFTGSVHQPRMQVINADGSIADMCGNGLRCFVKALMDEHGSQAPHLDVDTDAGRLRCHVSRDAEGKVAQVSVEMGRPTFDPAAVPVRSAEPMIAQLLSVDDVEFEATAVGVGNPHMVIFTPMSKETRLQLGPSLSSHPLWPARTNVEFCEVLSPRADGGGRILCYVHERGCGWTQACGTGATAVALAARRLGMVEADLAVEVILPGGALSIAFDDAGVATMTGPARQVFAGEVDLNLL